jgi:hypothetical protein
MPIYSPGHLQEHLAILDASCICAVQGAPHHSAEATINEKAKDISLSAQKRVRIRPRLARPYSSQVARRKSIGRSLPPTPAGSAGSAGKNSNSSPLLGEHRILLYFQLRGTFGVPEFKIHIVKLPKKIRARLAPIISFHLIEMKYHFILKNPQKLQGIQ